MSYYVENHPYYTYRFRKSSICIVLTIGVVYKNTIYATT